MKLSQCFRVSQNRAELKLLLGHNKRVAGQDMTERSGNIVIHDEKKVGR